MATPSSIVTLDLDESTGEINCLNVLQRGDTIASAVMPPNLIDGLTTVSEYSAGWGSTVISSVDSLSTIVTDTCTTVGSFSGDWQDTNDTVLVYSGGWNTAASTVADTSTIWSDNLYPSADGYTNWNELSEVVSIYSGAWSTSTAPSALDSLLQLSDILSSFSGSWGDTCGTVSDNSGFWTSAYKTLPDITTVSDIVTDNSGLWTSAYSSLPDVTTLSDVVSTHSGTWNEASTTSGISSVIVVVGDNSTVWIDVAEEVSSTSGVWNDTATIVDENAGGWNETDSTVTLSAAHWDQDHATVRDNSSIWSSGTDEPSAGGYTNWDEVSSQVSEHSGLWSSANEPVASSISGTVTTHTTQIGELSTLVDEDVTDLDGRVTTNTTHIGQLSTLVDEDVASLDGRVTTNTTHIGQLSTLVDEDVGALDGRVTTNTTHIGQLSTLVDEDVASLDGRITTNTNAIASNDTDIANNYTRVTNMSAIHDSEEAALDGRITTNTNNISINTTSAVKNHEDILYLSGEVDDNGTGISTNATRITDLQTSTEGVSSLVDADVTDLDDKITVQATRITNMSAIHDSEEAALDSRITSNDTDIANNYIRVTNMSAIHDSEEAALDGRITTNTNTIATNYTRVTNMSAIHDSEEAALDGRISTNTTNIGDNDTDIASNLVKINTNTANIASNDTDIANNYIRVTNMSAIHDSEEAALDGRITTNTNTIATNYTRVTNMSAIHDTEEAALDGRITTNTNAIASNDTDIASNLVKINTNTANIGSNDTDIANNYTRVTNMSAIHDSEEAALDGRITTNTNAIASNDTDIANNYTRVTNMSAIHDSEEAALDGRITTNTNTIATNYTRVTNMSAIHDSEEAALDGRITTNTNNIASNDTDIAVNAASAVKNHEDILYLSANTGGGGTEVTDAVSAVWQGTFTSLHDNSGSYGEVSAQISDNSATWQAGASAVTNGLGFSWVYFGAASPPSMFPGFVSHNGNALWQNISKVYLNATASGSINLSDWIDSWGEMGSTSNRGLLKIQLASFGGNFTLFQVSGEVDTVTNTFGTCYEIPVSILNQGTSYIPTVNNVICQFMPAGTSGAAGVDGAPGPSATGFVNWNAAYGDQANNITTSDLSRSNQYRINQLYNQGGEASGISVIGSYADGGWGVSAIPVSGRGPGDDSQGTYPGGQPETFGPATPRGGDVMVFNERVGRMVFRERGWTDDGGGGDDPGEGGGGTGTGDLTLTIGGNYKDVKMNTASCTVGNLIIKGSLSAVTAGRLMHFEQSSITVSSLPIPEPVGYINLTSDGDQATYGSKKVLGQGATYGNILTNTSEITWDSTNNQFDLSIPTGATYTYEVLASVWLEGGENTVDLSIEKNGVDVLEGKPQVSHGESPEEHTLNAIFTARKGSKIRVTYVPTAATIKPKKGSTFRIRRIL